MDACGAERNPDTLLAAFEPMPGVRYLNSAGQTPRLRSLQAAGHASVDASARPWEHSPDDWLARPARVRALAAQVYGVAAQCIALVPSVAYAMATAAANLPLHPGQRVLCLSEEHPSAIYAWARSAELAGATLTHLRRAPDADWTQVLLAALDRDVAVLVLPACHWHDGQPIDLQQVCTAARALGTAVVLDATQALGVLDLHPQALDADFIVAAGHKWLLGAPGLAYLYVAPRHHGGLPLEEHVWARVGGLSAAPRDRCDERAVGAARFDASGLLASAQLAMAGPALEQLTGWGPAWVRARLQLWQHALRAQCERGCSRRWQLTALSPHISALHLHGANAPAHAQMAVQLATQGILVAARGAGLRISPYLHNTEADAQALMNALTQ